MWESGFERDWLVAKGLQLRERAEALGQRDISRQADGWGALPGFDASYGDLAAGALLNMETQLDTLEAEIESLERGKLFGRPSDDKHEDDEVMSQIGTRVTCLLDNEADIRAVFSGVSGAGALREVLARLDTQQQALIMGHAVPMPVVIRARDYGEELYAALGMPEGADASEKVQQAKEGLFGN